MDLPRTPSSPLPAPHEYTSILHAIQRRTTNRVSEDGGLAWGDVGSPGTDAARLLHDLETDLNLSATIGAALLDEKTALEKRLRVVEGANQKLLDRLAGEVKETTQLQRKLEHAVSNLEQADASNRALLVSLEEDRKTISRLSVDSARLVTSSSQLKSVTASFEDTRQELVAEQKQRTASEHRVKKQLERTVELEDRLRKAIADLEEVRQDKILRTKKSNKALAKMKERFAVGLGIDTGAENPEMAELLKLVESLALENDTLRAEALDLHDMLDVSRDEQTAMRVEMGQRGLDDDEGREPLTPLVNAGGSRRLSQALLSDAMSPSVSYSFSDFDARPVSPTSTNPTSISRSPNYGSRSSDLARKLSTGSSNNGDEPTHRTHYRRTPELGGQPVRRHTGSNSVYSIGSGRIPFGRGHNRRAVSVDVVSLGRSNSQHDDNESYGHGSAPVSPILPRSPHTRPSSLLSDADEASIRPRRAHRPLSLSLGPSLFPQVPEDRQSPSLAYRHSPSPRHSHSHTMSVSTSGDPSLASAQSGLSLSSPERLRRSQSSGRQQHRSKNVDSETQTSPSKPSQRPRTTPATRIHADNTLASEMTRSSTFASELSERDKVLLDFGLPAGSFDTRTAVLGKLIEHAAKLLVRIQSADIASQEKRLKKQNLPGGVRHIAATNLKDLLSDIEGLRHHFRRLLEQERAAAAKESASIHSESTAESLVSRRDFVSLVKLFRDLLFETSRLRSLVNRVGLEPSLAASLRDLDVLNLVEVEKASKGAGGILAPLSRLFALTTTDVAPLPAPPKTPMTARPIAKLTGSSAVSSTTINVEFGNGAVRRATAVGGAEDLPSPEPKRPGGEGSPHGTKSGPQLKRDLSAIFVGGLPASRQNGDAGWVRVDARTVPSSNPFSRLLATYRPPLSATTNAIIDSIPHAPQPDAPYQPTLLERTHRRTYSDSSIRSTFVAHANPHARLITPASLALSSEISISGALARPIASQSLGVDDQTLRTQLTQLSSSVVMRKPSMGRLRMRTSSAQLRPSSPSMSVSIPREVIPPVPALPISISISPTVLRGPVPVVVAGSLFGNLQSWASKAAGFPSPLAARAEEEVDGGGVGVRAGP